ncbi:baseplate J/gp47 family protein [Solibacillus silvestris]|uniref:baseplate J/gp47 family protein n=1 Tax=Solibacillus silvestris TaxID=76853 RepID=UPI003F7CE30E
MTIPFSLEATFEDLQAIKRANVASIDPNLDMRETAPLFNATVVNSLETVQMIATLKHLIDLVYADTAPREYLIRRAAERGLKPYPATKAKLKAVFNIDVPMGARFSLDELNYVVIEKITIGEYIVECETPGNAGNLFLGNLIPIQYINNLQTAVLTDLLIPGEDEEGTEAFRTRYFNSFDSTSFGGNRADYKEKVGKLEGVGGVRVYRAKYGPGTVGLTIISSQFTKPTQLLINTVQEFVDPINLQGEGVGTAPIDHVVTVSGVNEEVINIALNITYQTGFDWNAIQLNVLAIIDTYFGELAEQWAKAVTYEEDHAGVIVRVSQIETRLLALPGVLDISDTVLNGHMGNIELDKESIPKRGAVSG